MISINRRRKIKSQPNITLLGPDYTIRGRAKSFPLPRFVRPRASKAEDFRIWLRDNGFRPIVKLSHWSNTGLKRTRRAAKIMGKQKRGIWKAHWLTWSQVRQLRKMDGFKSSAFDKLVKAEILEQKQTSR